MNDRSYFDTLRTPIGELTLRCNAAGALTHIDFDTDEARARRSDATRDRERLSKARSQLQEYFAGMRTRFDLELAPAGTAFQRAVWRELVAIPHGAVTSYSEIAQRIGAPKACRAVGAANGQNPLPIVVPCHRVIGRSGALTGYAGGLPMKGLLLELERPLAAQSERSEPRG